MSSETTISWTDSSWNPLLGCSKLSSGCASCYAINHVYRMAHNPNPKVRDVNAGLVARHANGQLDWTAEVRLIPERLDIPLHWKKPRRIFVNSLGDLFHEAVPYHVIDDVFYVMEKASWHTFQILTKRPERMVAWADSTNARHDDILGGYGSEGLSHIWLGVSIENKATLHRIGQLRDMPAAVRFLSLEPLLEDLGPLTLEGIHWVICGGESGPKARRCEMAWMRNIIDQCAMAQVACWVKQLGSDAARRFQWQDRKGSDPTEWPAEWRVQHMPGAGQHQQKETL